MLVAMNPTDTYVEDGVRFARMEVPVQVSSPERSEVRSVKLTFSLNLTTREGVFTGAFETRPNGATGRVPVSDPTLVIRPFRQIVTAHDEFTREPGSVTLSGSSTLSLVAYQVPAGTYSFGVSVSDLSNNASTSTTVITISDASDTGSEGCNTGNPGGGTTRGRGISLGVVGLTALVARRRARRASSRRAA